MKRTHRLNCAPMVWMSLMGLLMLTIGKARAGNPYDLPDGLFTEITTEAGVVVGELFYEQVPMTVANYVGLAEGALGPAPRKPFYDGLAWCRVVPGLVVQGGDPKGTGEGDAGYLFPDEVVPGLRHDAAGVIQMGNDGPDTNGSQYCLMLSPQHRLNYQHTVFGRVVRGLELLPKIKQGDTMKVKILRLGNKANAFQVTEASFATMVAKASRYAATRTPGPDAAFDDADHLLPKEWDRAMNFNYKLANVARFTNTKIVARLFATLPAAAAKETEEVYWKNEANRLGVAQRGALAVYIAKEDRWVLRIGETSVAHFMKSGPNGEKEGASGTLTEAQSALLKAAAARADEAIATMIKRLPPEDPMTESRRLKLKTDAVLDALIFKLEADK